MAKEKSLVDAFLFADAKRAVDNLTKTPEPLSGKKTVASSEKRKSIKIPFRDKTPSNKKSGKSPKKAPLKKPDKASNLDSDLVTHSDSHPDSTPKTNRVTQPDSDLYTDPVTQSPSDIDSDPVTQRPGDIHSDIVTQRPSDIDSQRFLYIDDDRFKEIAVVDLSKKPEDLTLRQYCLLHYIYFHRPFKVVADGGLGMVLNMGSNNAKYQVVSLHKKGYICKPYGINDGINKGSTCRVIEKKCYPLFGSTNITNPPERPTRINDIVTYTVTQSPTHIDSDPHRQRPSDLNSDIVTHLPSDIDSDPPNSSISSSSLINNTTTFKEIFTLPELQYWKQKGVTLKQVSTWMKEAGIASEIDMIEYLSWAAFDMRSIDGNNIESEKGIKDPAAWVRKILIKNGGYPKPNNYESFADAELRKEKEQIEKLKRLAAEKRKLREEKREAEIDLAFEDMLEGKGDQFKACEKDIGDFVRKRRNTRTYMEAMRAAFEKLYYS